MYVRRNAGDWLSKIQRTRNSFRGPFFHYLKKTMFYFYSKIGDYLDISSIRYGKGNMQERDWINGTFSIYI